MNALSACCHREVVSQWNYYPTNWYENTRIIKVDVCTCCGMDVKDYVQEVKEDEESD